jgi:hypothetical protein
MKKLIILSMILLVYGGGRLLSQQPNAQYNPKYLRENDQNFKEITTRTDNGWIEFKKDKKSYCTKCRAD